MKIAIPMESDKVCPHFGKSPYFLIVNIDENTKEIINTKVVDNVPCDGQGHGKSVKIILDENPEAVIFINMGANSMENLSKKGIELYRCETDDVDECIRLFLDGKLEKIN